MKLLDGGSHTQIALALGIQRNTVNNYVRSVYRKTGMANRKALVRWWTQRLGECGIIQILGDSRRVPTSNGAWPV